MSNDPADDAGLPMFDEDDFDDGENRTVVDDSLWSQPKIPHYPALATFGRFEILGRIARGGMAEVFLAREAQSDGSVRHVVLKRVLPEMADDPGLLSMFLEEGRTAVRLYHANICHVYECGEIDGTAFMALEWVYGPSFSAVIERAAARGELIPWPIAVDIVMQVASALHYVHHAKGSKGQPLDIVHRDVSPHNVMLSWTGNVKLLDFGIAKTSANEGDGATIGKYGYMSPEQARSMPIDSRSDLFALGIVLFEALTGKPLYDRPTVLETLSAIVREPVPSLSRARPDLPPELAHIVERALAKDPAERWQSAGEMRAALKQVLRASNQIVADKRIALTVDGLFSAAEKAPLNAGAQRLTGSFRALTDVGLANEQVTFEIFDHRSEPPPRPSAVEAEPAPKSNRRLWLYLGLGALFVVATAAGATTALLLSR